MMQNAVVMPPARAYQQEMLNESLRRNIIIALETGAGKTLIAVLRIKHELERESTKISWFFAPTVALCQQQLSVITAYLPVSVGIVSGANEPDQWKDAALWQRVIVTHRVMVSTPQVFLDALRHGYVSLGQNVSLLVFDEAHHAVDNHPYNRIMKEFYFNLEAEERPMVLGLTASPIYGGNVEKAFHTIETNLDSTIRAPRNTRAELASFVHPPVFKHIFYAPASTDSPPFSTNLAALTAIFSTIKIEDDPYVLALRDRLRRTAPGTAEYLRTDRRLSRILVKQDSFTRKGLGDFARAAHDICVDIGPWAADWFVHRVLDRARSAANPYSQMMATWKSSEKGYLLSIINRVVATPVSYYEEDIKDDLSDKTRTLIECLLQEKKDTEDAGETYSCIIFVQRRDAVLALAEVLKHHPDTKDVFVTGTLLGTSESGNRHALMDITRALVREDPQEVVLAEFKTGDRNLIISTAVAEEGIDIQACGSVIRWDLPPNMASWAQSKGRARKRRSTFTMMFQEGSGMEAVGKWIQLEEQMRELYNDPNRDIPQEDEDGVQEDPAAEDDDMILEVVSTGALLTLHSAISHLTHFCAVIPNTIHADNNPIFDLDPPAFPEGWHFTSTSAAEAPPVPTGPFGSTVTLPRALPLPPHERTFTVPRIYPSAISAHRHAAFEAYRALYYKGLLNDHLLPITGIGEKDLEEDVREMLREVERREGMASVLGGVDVWAAPRLQGQDTDVNYECWYTARISIPGLPPLRIFTRSPHIALDSTEGPTLYAAGRPPRPTSLQFTGQFICYTPEHRELIDEAREWTRAVFWGLNGNRMVWERKDFGYLLFPAEPDTEDLEDIWAEERKVNAIWAARRAWHARITEEEHMSDVAEADTGEQRQKRMQRLTHPADIFAAQFGHVQDITLVQRHLGFGRPFRFLRWRWEQLDENEEARCREIYRNQYLESELVLTYPLLEVEPFPPRSNFLIPVPPPKMPVVDESSEVSSPLPDRIHLLPQHSGVVFLSPSETEYAFLLPSILRFLTMRMTAQSLRSTLFVTHHASDAAPTLDSSVSTTDPSTHTSMVGASAPPLLCDIPLSLLTTAITASSTGEKENYQRLETLGDTVLKFVCGLNLLAEYPVWHEGYLTRKKDHAVSNVRLAKEDVKRGLYRWIIRDIMLGRKWKPHYTGQDKIAGADASVNSITPAVEIQETGKAVQDTSISPIVAVAGESIIIPFPEVQVLDAPVSSAPAKQAVSGKKSTKKKRKKNKSSNQLSTKILADVVESTIGAAYLHGGLDLGYECIRFFDLGVRWAPLANRITQLLARVDALSAEDFTVPPLLTDVERMLGYTFKRKLLLFEALTHASYQQDSHTPSYERMEFLGDSVLDLIVTNMLYHASGKHYSPGHMHLRKSAVVNMHILAYFCLNMTTTVDTVMPHPIADSSVRGKKQIEERKKSQVIPLYKCLLHSSPKVLEDQMNTANRFNKWAGDIEASLMSGATFPWAALTRLQAPKFFSDMVESIIGAVFIDSEGSLPVVVDVVRKFRIIPLLEHIIKDDVDILHPVSRLSLWAQKHGKEISYDIRREGGKVTCGVVVDGVEEAVEEAHWRGKPSQEEVKYNVAEKAIKKFKLRDVGVGYESLKKKAHKKKVDEA